MFERARKAVMAIEAAAALLKPKALRRTVASQVRPLARSRFARLNDPQKMRRKQNLLLRFASITQIHGTMRMRVLV